MTKTNAQRLADRVDYGSESTQIEIEVSTELRRLDAENAQLRAELEAVRRDAWQPIETAPKDGSLFICWVSAIRYGETDEGQQYQEDVSQIDFCNWRTQSDIPDCGWFDPFCGQIGHEQGVTHWMPLPPSPIDAAQAERAKGG